jgi:acyl carrier protein
MYIEILKYLKDKICELGFEEAEIEEESKIRSDLGLDSSEVVEISLNIKNDYNLDIDLKEDLTIREIIKLGSVK